MAIGRSQSARASFTGVETSVNITWPTVYATRRYARNVSSVGVVVGVNFTTDDGTTLTVTPDEPFVGDVDVINLEVL